MRNIPTVYLDTCVVSGIASNDLSDKEQNALSELLRLYKEQSLRLVTSATTHDEISKIPPEHRAKHEDMYNLLSDVQVAPVGGLSRLGPHGLAVTNPDWSLWGDLTNLLSEKDAKHVYHAIKNRIEYFVTTDHRTILHHKKNIWGRFRIYVLWPSEAVSRLGNPQLIP